MKSYRDLDKEIILNAPEGAMWVIVYDDGQIVYYDSTCGKVYTITPDHHQSIFFPNLADIQNSNATPLPNIEIPWEATEDSVCPVSKDTIVVVKWLNKVHTSKPQPASDFYWDDGDRVVSYKIIDEEYLPKEDEAPKEHTITAKADVTLTLPDNPNLELIKNLEFLQILANKFPEIKDKVVELMEVELDAWWHGTLEERVDE